MKRITICTVTLVFLGLFSCSESPKKNQIKIIAEKNQNFETNLKSQDHSFKFLPSFTIDDSGNIYVIENNRKIVKMNKETKPVWRLDKSGQGPGEFIRITNIFFRNDKIFVCDQGSSKIIIFSSEGKFLSEFKTKIVPLHLVVSHDEIIIFSSFSPIKGNLLHKYNNKGKYLGSLVKGKYKDKNKFLESAKNGLTFTINSNDTIITAFYCDNQLYEYDLSGKILAQYVVPLEYTLTPLYLYKPAPNQMQVKGDFAFQDLCTDKNNNIYIFHGKRIEKKGYKIEFISKDKNKFGAFWYSNKLGSMHKIRVEGINNMFILDMLHEPFLQKYNMSIKNIK